MDETQQPRPEIDNLHLVERLAKLVADRLAPAMPLSIQLWNARAIAKYLQRSPAVVLERVVTLPDFPTPIRLPSTASKSRNGVKPRTGKFTGQPLWKAIEVIGWVNSHRQTLAGRPRNLD